MNDVKMTLKLMNDVKMTLKLMNDVKMTLKSMNDIMCKTTNVYYHYCHFYFFSY